MRAFLAGARIQIRFLTAYPDSLIPFFTAPLYTIVFLLGDGAFWAYDGHAERVHAPGFPALADLMDSFVEAGGELQLCSACDAACAQPGARRREVLVRGMASLLSHAVGGSAVTF